MSFILFFLLILMLFLPFSIAIYQKRYPKGDNKKRVGKLKKIPKIQRQILTLEYLASLSKNDSCLYKASIKNSRLLIQASSSIYLTLGVLLGTYATSESNNTIQNSLNIISFSFAIMSFIFILSWSINRIHIHHKQQIYMNSKSIKDFFKKHPEFPAYTNNSFKHILVRDRILVLISSIDLIVFLLLFFTLKIIYFSYLV